MYIYIHINVFKMGRKQKLVQGIKELHHYIDVETGEEVHLDIKKHSYLSDKKEEFLLLYTSVLAIFNNLDQSEIRVYSVLLENADGQIFGIDKPFRNHIAEKTNLNERTVYNTIIKLIEKGLLIKHSIGTYQINPKYAFKGSSRDRNDELKVVLELEYKKITEIKSK
jgi:predicted transcriptional regulator